MSLKYMLLGFLSYGPESGYAMHKKFFDPGRPKLSQVYRTLKQMSAEGLVTSVREHQDKLPARNLYNLTKKGRADFQRWMSGSWPIAPVKERLLLKLSFGALSKQKTILSGLDAFIEGKKQELAYYESTARDLIEEAAQRRDDRDRFYWNLVLDFLERRCRAELDWAEEAVQKIARSSPEENSVAGKGKNSTDRPSTKPVKARTASAKSAGEGRGRRITMERGNERE